MASGTGPITMTAAELELRHNGGNRFRLVALPFMRPSAPPKVAGQWPLITLVEPTADEGPQQILVSTEALPGEAYEAHAGDTLVVIPVHPEQAARSTQTREAVSA
jgi:hypothetical protein